MEERYEFKRIEKKWQNYWEENNSFKSIEDPSKEKYYVGAFQELDPAGGG